MTDITIATALDTDATYEQLARLAELTERYCVVAQTLTPRPTLTVVRVALPRPPRIAGLRQAQSAWYLNDTLSFTR